MDPSVSRYFWCASDAAVSDAVPESLDDICRWGDFNGDGLIDEQDLSLLLSNLS